MVRTQQRRACVLALALVFVSCSSRSPKPTGDTAPPEQPEQPVGTVAADHPLVEQVGAAVLADGGNAVDAAVAMALTLGVVNPTSSGIGGGGFAVVYIASEDRAYIVDFREVAPAAMTPETFLRDGELDTSLSRAGGLAVGAPGEVAGLAHMIDAFGARSWHQAVAPALALARDGFAVHSFFADAIASSFDRGLIPDGSVLAELLAPGGVRRGEGDEMRRPALAETLRRIGEQGPEAFYTGAIAEDIVATVTAGGGVMTAEDLAGYEVARREPLVGLWRDMRVFAPPLPSSGGIILLELLALLDASNIDLATLQPTEPTTYHVIVELLKHAFADRARFLGDAEPATLAANALLDPERLAEVAARISVDGIQPHDSYGDQSLTTPADPGADGGTSHLCAIDGAGNAVSLTTTVNGYFGSKLVTNETGIVLNNQIDDFSLRSGVPNMFGLVQSDYNLVGPGKRPLSSMSPTLVVDADGVVACVGGSGGPFIISNSFQVLLNSFVFGMDATAAVSAARVHHQWLPDQVVVDEAVTDTARAGLKAKGHDVVDGTFTKAVQLIRRRPDGTLDAASDPRKFGGAD